MKKGPDNTHAQCTKQLIISEQVVTVKYKSNKIVLHMNQQIAHSNMYAIKSVA